MDRRSIRNADSPRGNEASASDHLIFLISRTSIMKMKKAMMEWAWH